MGKNITLHRGYNIRLQGAPAQTISDVRISDIVAVKPSDWPGIKPKVLVEPGDQILAGQLLFTDKIRPELQFSSPVSGEIAEIVLGEKRRILEVRILADKEETRYVSFSKVDLNFASKEEILNRLTESGCWNYIRQRPYSIIANPAETPKSIFISLFDTSPLAPDLSFILALEKDKFLAGLQALDKLAPGKIHLSLQGKQQTTSDSSIFPPVTKENIHFFSGPHPAGNVGIQIHHIDPIQKGDIVWYIHPQEVIILGRLFSEGRYRADRIIALTGGSVTEPGYRRVITGQRMKEVVQNQTSGSDHRIIQGNVLTGKSSSAEDFISFYTNQVTIIPEGNEPEFLGWLLPGLQKLSLSRTYLSWLMPKRQYNLDTNTHGEERAFVMTGQYDKVLPMNIYPVHLLKAILAQDLEKMEALGIYEVSEEDFALCEFVCTSKIKVQQIIREGLDLMLKEG